MGVQLWGRDHIAPYSTRIPLKAGEFKNKIIKTVRGADYQIVFQGDDNREASIIRFRFYRINAMKSAGNHWSPSRATIENTSSSKYSLRTASKSS